MGIKNLTEAEEKEFYRLVGKMNGKEPDKKQDAKVKKPQYGDTVYYINYIGRIRKRTWINDEDDLDMWELGNIFFTEEEAKFEREKRKVEVELERYAKEHNGPIHSDSFYLSYSDSSDEKLDRCIECMKEHEQLAEWLEELKELRGYKKKMKTQFLDDVENPLEPIKLSSALESEIFKYEYRTEHDPQKISPLDYTIIYALKHCLEEQLKGVE